MRVTKRQISKVVRAIYATPWAIQYEKLQEIMGVIDRRAKGQIAPSELLSLTVHEDGPEDRPVTLEGGIQVIPLQGVVAKRMNLLTQISGGTSTELLIDQIERATADGDIKSIILDVDSPGGAVEGLHEATEAIRAAREVKPVIAMANETMASAAFWLGSAATEIVTTPTGKVGSIGVFGIHRDTTAADEKDGIKTTVFRSGPFKAAEMLPLTEETSKEMQATVDQAFDLFIAEVGRNRPQVTESKIRDLGGRVLLGSKALEAGLVDRIGTLQGEINRLRSSRVTRDSVVAFVPPR